MSGGPLDTQRKKLNRRRRRLKWFLGAALIAVIAAISFTLTRSARRRSAAVKGAPLPSNVNRRLSGYTFTRSEEGHQVFTIHAARTLAYGPGASTVLDDVHVTIFGRQGNRHDEVQAKRCDYDTKTGALACSGSASVKLQSKPGMQAAPDFRSTQPLFLETSDVRYDPHQSLIETDQPVQFRFGPASGSATGLRYSTQAGWLSLLSDVAVQSPLQRGAGGLAHVTAGTLLYEKGRITLRPRVSMEEGARHLAASEARIFLDSRNRATRIVFSGGVRGSERLAARTLRGSAANAQAELNAPIGQVRAVTASGSVSLESRSLADGSVRRITGERAEIRFSGPGGKPQAGSVGGGYSLGLIPAAAVPASQHPNTGAVPASKRILTGSELRFSFRPDGALREAHTTGSGTIQITPLDPKLARQTITAGGFRLAFNAAGRLETLTGSGGTRITDYPPTGADRTSSAEELVANVDPATGEIYKAVQKGKFQFRQGEEQASADRAVYSEGGQEVTLEGNPQVWDADSRVKGRHIVLYTAREVAQGWGGVQSVYFSRSDGSRRRGLLAPAAPRDNPPLIVLAGKVVAHRQQGLVHYEGKVRAWRGADVIEAPSLDVNQKTRDVVASAGVTTTWVQTASHPVGVGHSGVKIAQPAPLPVTIRADRMIYSDLRHRATYSGNVQMESGTTAVDCGRLEVYFAPAAGEWELERALASGGVRVTQQPGRRGRGERAEYFAAAGKIVLTGGPPVVYDEQQGLVTGRELTFFVHDASLLANGGKHSQVLSKRRVPRQ